MKAFPLKHLSDNSRELDKVLLDSEVTFYIRNHDPENKKIELVLNKNCISPNDVAKLG